MKLFRWWWVMAVLLLGVLVLWVYEAHAQEECADSPSYHMCVTPRTPTPTLTATPVPPTPTPAPTPVPSCISIISPANGATVSGIVPLPTSDTCPAYWESVDVDGVRNSSGSPGKSVLDTASLTNGTHMVTVNAQSANPGSVVLGSASVTLDVQNASPTPVPSASQTPVPPTPTATPTSVACTQAPALNITSAGTYDGTGKCVPYIKVSASNVTVKNYDVSNQTNNLGIWVASGSNVVIRDNKVHDLCREGIQFDSGVSSSKILGNVVTRASMAGIMIRGTNNEMGFNEVSDTVQYPSAVGGKFANCQRASGADADCFRWFGSGHTVHDNYCHDVANDWGSARNKDPHVDCIQTWGPLTNSRFTGNRCLWGNANGSVDREFCEHEGLNGPTNNLTFDHNLFTGGRDGCMFETGVTGVTFTNNTLVGYLNGGVNVYTSGNIIRDNIVYDGGASSAAWRCDGSAAGVTNNDRFLPHGSYGNYGCTAPDAFKLNPLFVYTPANFDDYPSGDYHLQPNSPVPTLGAYPLSGAESHLTTEDAGGQ